jgi:membrane protein implicated in regulation of membrane protease activity
MKAGVKGLPLSLLVTALAFGGPAHAYIGPGVGLGAIGVTIAIVLGLVLLVAGFLWYPLKRLFRRRDRKQESGSTDTQP